jgi:hypothetical protein
MVCIKRQQLNEIKREIELYWKIFMINFFVLLRTSENGKFEIFTFTTFRENKCELSDPISLGVFDDDSSEFQNFVQIPPLVTNNLHKCLVSVTLIAVEGAVNRDFKSGYEIDLLIQLSRDMNFTIKHAESDKLSMLAIGGFTPGYSTAYSYISSTTTYASFDFVFIIPQSENLTSFEIISLPFDNATWILIFTTFFISVITICVIKIMSNNIQQFVFGTNVKTPITNLMIGFFGGSQTQLPGRNFARYILIFYLHYCLIIRTCYQSKLNSIMQSDRRKPEMKTIDQLIESDLMLFADISDEIMFNETFSR